MKDDQIQELLGFDLGDGESAVAWAGADSAAAPLLLEIAGRKNIITALGEKDGWKIGEQAFLSDSGEVYLRFKSRYLKEPESVGILIQRFAKRVREEIEKTGKLANPSACAVFAGCPSGWKDETRKAYRQLFVNAGFENVEIVSESRAAFMFIRESGELRAPEETLYKPSLIIDAGSSTTDFTFVDRLAVSRAFDFGENALGGGLIDKMVLEKSLKSHSEGRRIGEIFALCPPYEARCELEARRVKELYFNRLDPRGALSMPCESSVKIYYDNPPITLDISLTQADMDGILRQKRPELQNESYLTAYQKSLDGARRALLSTLPQTVLLTGGASRMDFMKTLAQKTFPEAELLIGAEPEYSIARGLLYALRVDRRTAQFEKSVHELIESTAVEDMVTGALPRLFDAVAPLIADALIDQIAPSAFGMWKRGELSTMGDMEKTLGEMLARSVHEGALKDELAAATAKWLETLRPGLERLTDPICAACHLPPATLRLSAQTPVDAASLKIETGQLVDLSLIQTVLDVAVASIAAGILGGGGMALLMAGPLGWIASFMIAFVASRLGTTLARQHVGGMNIPPLLRALFSQRAFARTLSRRREELMQSVDAQLKSAKTGLTLTQNMTAAIETQLGEMARRARMLIH